MENIFGVRTDIASVDADERFVMVGLEGRSGGVFLCEERTAGVQP